MYTLTITYEPETGNVNVNGPVHTKGVCYLMLEMARDAVHDYKPDANGVIVPVSPKEAGRKPARVPKRFRK